MKIDTERVMGITAAVILGVTIAVGCARKSDTEPARTAGVGEQTGAALDRAAEKTVEVATNVAAKTAEASKAAAAATKDAAGKVVEKTGEAVEKAGAAVEGAGADMQK